MAKLFQRRVRVLLGAAIAGFGLWWGGEHVSWLHEVDRLGFRALATASANGPFFISGEGNHERPWELRTRVSSPSTDKLRAPVLVTMSQSSTQYFPSYPLSDDDWTGVFRNVKGHGARHVAIGSLMAWSNTGLTPQRERLNTWLGAPKYESKTSDPSVKPVGFQSLVTVTPLGRSASPEPMPAAFIRASLHVEDVHGDVGGLPVGNALWIPGTILGDLHTMAGFSVLEVEHASDAIPLVARWDDRIVFSFPIVACLAERGWPADEVELRPGEYLKLAADGPVIPIDAAGNLAAVLPKVPAEPLTVDSLLDVETKFIEDSIVFREDGVGADARTKAFSANLASLMATVRSDAFLTPAHRYPRLPLGVEACILTGLVFLLTLCGSASVFKLRLSYGIILAVLMVAQMLSVTLGSVWLPGLAFMGATLTGFVVAWPFERKLLPILEEQFPGFEHQAHQQEEDEIVPAAEAEREPEPMVATATPAEAGSLEVPPAEALPPPAKKTARKAAKKTAAKKVPSKAVAKKAARKTARKAAPEPPATGETPSAEAAPGIPAKKAASKAAKKAAKKTAKKAAKKTPKTPPPDEPESSPS